MHCNRLVVCAAIVVSVLVGQGVASAGVPYTKGDVFASIGNGKVKEFTPTGTLVQTLDTTTNASETTGSAFDSAGNFFVTGFGTSTLSKFDNSGNLLNSNLIAGNNPTHNESLVFDNAGNFYVGGAESTIIRKFDPTGALLNTFTVATEDRGSDWIDLAADQKTIFYTSEGGKVLRFDTSTNTQLPDFADIGGRSFALRILSDGGALVAHTTDVIRLDNTGTIAHTYNIPGGNSLFALNLDPDGTTFWTGNIDSVGTVFHVRISDGTVLGQFGTVSPGGNDLAGLSIFGEITQGCTTCGGGSTVPEPSTVFLLASGLLGLGAWRSRKSK